MLNAIASALARVTERSELARSLLRKASFRGKRRIVAHLRGDRLPSDDQLAHVHGLTFRCDLSDDIQREIYFGIYEDGDVRRLLREVPVGGTCIDVGANVGFYALHMAKRVGPTGRVYAFEPDPVNRHRLTENARLNSLRIAARPEAVSDHVGEAVFHRSSTEHSGWGSLTEFSDIAESTVKVPVTTLDAFLSEQRIDSVDVLKVDVEAHEPELIAGAQATLRAQRVNRILIEFNGVRLAERGYAFSWFLGAFATHGYEPVELVAIRDPSTAVVNLLLAPR